MTGNPAQPLIIAGGGGGSGGGGQSSNLDSEAKHGQAGNNAGAATAPNGKGGAAGMDGDGGKAGTGQYNAGGGGGLRRDGQNAYASDLIYISSGGKAFINGGTGGYQGRQENPFGGFGGGGGGSVTFISSVPYYAGGGGGGYSGGGGSSIVAGVGGGVGGGGSSYNAGTNPTNIAGANSGNGLVTISYTPARPIRYVKQGGSGTGDGSSWANASGDLLAMIDASGVLQVWVAAGRYTTTSNYGSFALRNGVAVYGGFRGTETRLEDRPGVNPVNGTPSSSTLINGSDTHNPVIRNTGADESALLDGVVITGTGASYGGDGGGIFLVKSSPRLVNCVISGNTASSGGGGMFNSDSNPSLVNCVISNNTTSADRGYGGGIYNVNSNPSLVNCIISGNTTSSLGGGIYNSNSSPSLINCVISGNIASVGGGIWNYGLGGSMLINCTLTANRVINGGIGAAIYTNGSNVSMTNTILWDNQGDRAISYAGIAVPVASYCLIDSSVRNYVSSPTDLTATTSPFVSPTNLRLKSGSPAIDAGSNLAYNTANGPATDLAGNPRFANTLIDIGAYEYCNGTPVAITRQPVSSSSVAVSTNISVMVSVGGTPSSYQWVRDNTSNPVAGQTSATLSLTNVQLADAGSYSLIITGACNSITSTAFSLSVSQSQPTGSFAITAVSTVSCQTVTATQRRVIFTPHYAGLSGSPVSFSVVNELVPTTAAGPYKLDLYIDNPTISLKATQSGNVGEATYSYNWLAACNGGEIPPPTGTFSITGVSTTRCEVISVGERRLTFTPRYGGDDGSMISFSVINELAPTPSLGSYTLRLYTDNPVIILSAQQSRESAYFSYAWLAACGSAGRQGALEEVPLSVVVLSNPVVNETVRFEVRGAEGQPLRLSLTNASGTVLGEQRVERAASVEVQTLHMGPQPTGILLLQVSTPTQSRMVKVLKGQ